MKLTSIKSRLAYLDVLIKEFDGLGFDRKLLMMLLYWKVFDKIAIPDELMREIAQKATHPDTVMRRIRELNHETRPIKNLMNRE